MYRHRLFLPLLSLFFLIPSGIAHAAINPVFTPSRTSGVAPLSVFFDAASTTDSGVTTQPFHDLDYAWSFGDLSAGVWGYGTASTSKNIAFGPEAAHVFETPGTYIITLTVKDGSTTSATTTTVTVQDPDTVFAGSNTICFSTNTDFTGCPSGAIQRQTSAYAIPDNFHTAAAEATSGNSIRRLLFHRGQTWTAATTGVFSSPGPGLVGAFGSGAAPKILAPSGDAAITLSLTEQRRHLVIGALWI